MAELNPIGIAVPFFFGLMVIEFLYARLRGRSLYRFNDTIAALTCGMGDQIVGLLSSILVLGIYQYVYASFGQLKMSVSEPITWVVGIVAVDLCYYAYHRFSHRVNFAWATHVVHHQSEEYNLAVALRQSWFTQSYSWVFYMPLAVLGLPTVVWAGSFAANLLYQYWIHTRAIGKLGPIEWVMNTPSHHRVHHGTNPEYIDKNYAGIFIVWDRLFGTFEEEQAEVIYGIMKPLQAWNPLTANLMPIVTLARDSWAQVRLTDKLKMWIAEPGWTPAGVVQPAFPAPGRGYDVNMEPRLTLYILTHLVPVGVATAFVIAYSKLWPASWLALGAAYIFWTGMNWSGLIEGTRWGRVSEWSRLVAVGLAGGAGAVLLTGPLVWVAVSLVTLSMLSLPWFGLQTRPVAA